MGTETKKNQWEVVQSPDSNVVELKSKTDGRHDGTMLRLALLLEMLGDSDLDLGGDYDDLWSYLQSNGFDQPFVEEVAKPYWRTACRIVSAVPYSHVIMREGIKSERRLAAHLLREVCRLMGE